MSKHSKKCTFYTLRFDCIHCRKATTKPQSVKGAFLRMLTINTYCMNVSLIFCLIKYLVRAFSLYLPQLDIQLY